MKQRRICWRTCMAFVLFAVSMAGPGSGSGVIGAVYGNTVEINKTEELTGDGIIARVDAHEKDYEDLHAQVDLILNKNNGQQRSRSMIVDLLENNSLQSTSEKDSERQAIIEYRRFVFTNPADIKGTAVLIHAKTLELDNLWLYLPAFKRLKRISGGNRSARFVGSEYYYEDLSPQKQHRYKNTYLGMELRGDKRLYQVERIPLFEKSSYKKLHVYVDPETYRYVEIHYFNKKIEHIKTQYFYDYTRYLDRYLISNRQLMVNHKTGDTTSMKWGSVKLKNNFSLSKFTKKALKRKVQ